MHAHSLCEPIASSKENQTNNKKKSIEQMAEA